MIGLLALIPTVYAQEATEYYIIIEDNGNTLVSITITGSGIYRLPIPADVDEVLVRGGLHLVHDDYIEVSIGETREAVVLYTTSLLTSKTDGNWKFNMDTGLQNNNIVILMPDNTKIISSNPSAYIQTGDITELRWAGINSIEISYSFEKELPKTTDPIIFVFAAIGIIIIIGIGLIIHKMKPGLSKKESVIKTLSVNEKKIVNIVVENKGVIRRSELEKKSGISKSSLAAALKNLEKKKILVVDKTYPAHSIKLTEWFNEL